MKKPLLFVSVLVEILCGGCAFGQTVAYQFKVEGFTATIDSAKWAAADGGSVMTSVHAGTNGWSLAVKDGGAVYFDNGVSSPLGFPDSATNTSI
jgi:streptogramin lyase